VVKRSSSARANRELQLALLARREAMLHDFLVEIGTERPAWQDPQVYQVANGISIGPASVDIDFVGNPVIRARITNATTEPLDLVVSLDRAHASTLVERLQPGESRTIELLGARDFTPGRLDWRVTRL